MDFSEDIGAQKGWYDLISDLHTGLNPIAMRPWTDGFCGKKGANV